MLALFFSKETVMWFLREDSSRDNFGPEYGTDFARFADPSDEKKDLALQKLIQQNLALQFQDHLVFVDVHAHNGFAIIKGTVTDEETRQEVLQIVRSTVGVVDIINDLHLDTSQGVETWKPISDVKEF